MILSSPLSSPLRRQASSTITKDDQKRRRFGDENEDFVWRLKKIDPDHAMEVEYQTAFPRGLVIRRPEVEGLESSYEALGISIESQLVDTGQPLQRDAKSTIQPMAPPRPSRCCLRKLSWTLLRKDYSALCDLLKVKVAPAEHLAMLLYTWGQAKQEEGEMMEKLQLGVVRETCSGRELWYVPIPAGVLRKTESGGEDGMVLPTRTIWIFSSTRIFVGDDPYREEKGAKNAVDDGVAMDVEEESSLKKDGCKSDERHFGMRAISEVERRRLDENGLLKRFIEEETLGDVIRSIVDASSEVFSCENMSMEA